MNIIADIEKYEPFNIQEEKDKINILHFINNYEDIFYRENEIAHMTASAWVTNKDKDRILMAYHKIYDSWSWLGGHCDGNQNCLKVAIEEVKEESGVRHVEVLSEDIFSLEVLSVDSHIKNGIYVPTHLHLNLTYLLQADESDLLEVKQDENTGVSWFGIDEAVMMSNEKWFRNNIYSKLNEKLRKLYENN